MRKLFLILLLTLFIGFVSPQTVFARWEHDAISLPKNPINNTSPSSIKIAIIDSGIADNDYLRSHIAQGFNFLEDNKDYTDTYGHGTKVSGILVDLAEETGLNMQLLPLKTVNNKGCSSSENIVRAINHAIEENVDVINISMANKQNLPQISNAVNRAIKKDIAIVSATGNDGKNICLYPASYEKVLSVGSIQESQEMSWFSNYNDKIDVVAPGDHITTMELDGTYGIHGGTSYSAPFVTFEVALLKAIYPGFSNDEIIQIISETAIDKGKVGYDVHYGNGVINYSNAIDNSHEALKEDAPWESYNDILLDKFWTIEFNDIVGEIGEVSIIDEYYTPIPVETKIIGDKITVTPLEMYEEDTIYSLIIRDIISSSGTNLKENIKMKFKTIKTNKSHIKLKSNNLLMPDLMPH